MRKNTMPIFLVAAVAILWLAGGTAQAHTLGFSSVDGCEIRWQESTQYDTERVAAEDGWEALKGGDNCVDILPDTIFTVNDLEWFDIDDEDVAVEQFHYYSGTGVADEIYLNDFYMVSLSACGKKSVAMHEMGHAHGLAHTFDPEVMTEDSYPCVIGTHDTSDYNSLW
jgi:hypothetical protein